MKKYSLLLAILSCLIGGQAVAEDTTAKASAPGMILDDPNRSIKFTAPNALWGIYGSKYSIDMSHDTYFDATVVLHKAYSTGTTTQELYTKTKDSLKSYLPGAMFLKENEAVTLGNTQGVSMTYKSPSDLTILRVIVFLHKGSPYELTFKVKEENFDKVKADFSGILARLLLY